MKNLITSSISAGIAEWICCPGRKNATLITSLTNCPLIHCWSQADERTAAYFALGRIQASGRPTIVVAGEGASAAALSPAVVEAYYQRRPLIIITITEKENEGGCGSPGSIETDGLFGMYAPTQDVNLPCAVADLPDFAAIAADGFPIHLNIRLRETPTYGELYSHLRLGDAPKAPRFRGSVADLARMLRFYSYEGLVLLIGGLEPSEQEPVLWLAKTLRVPVIADASSGLREELSAFLVHGADILLQQTPPRYVLRVGDVPTCDFWTALEDMPETKVFSITRTGFAGLCRESSVIEGDPEQIMKALGDIPHIGDTERILPKSRGYAGRVEELLLAYPESEAALIRAFSYQASIADVLSLGSASAIRLWNLYAQTQIPTIYLRTNNATGGADGTVTSFLANTANAEYACCLTGDISVLRDSAAASMLPQLPPGKRIVAVLNNGGAGRSNTEELPNELQRLLVQPPVYQLQDLAQLWGARYYQIRTQEDLEILETLPENTFALLEIIPDAEQSRDFNSALTL